MTLDISRELYAGERDGQLAWTHTSGCDYPALPATVWDLLCRADQLEKWFLPVAGELRIGGRYQLQGNAGGTIIACDPPREFSLTWEMKGNVSWVGVQLEHRGDGACTALLLTHAAHVPEEFWTQYGPGATGVGWDLALEALRQHLADDGAGDWQSRAGWAETDDGRAFIRASSQAWAQASIAAGTDSQAALAAADRTTEFYGG